MPSPEQFRPPEPESERDLKDVDLNGLASSMKEYNRQFNIGTLAGEAIVGAMDGEERTPREKKLSVEHLEAAHRETLERTGLGLEPVKGHAVLFTGREEIPSSEMRLNVVDGSKFVGYLHTLDEGSLSESQVKGLKTVVDSLTAQLTEQYDLSDPDDERMHELFGSLDQIIEQYRRLDGQGKTGLGHSVEEVATYLDVARKRYLREYLLAQHESLLAKAEDKRFGPSWWWGDSTPESYKGYWESALEATKKIGENPNAQPLYRDVVDNLKESLRHTKEKLRTPLDSFKEEEVTEKRVITDEMYETLDTM